MSIQRVLALSLAVYFVNFVGSTNVMADDDVIVIEPDEVIIEPDEIVPEPPDAPIDDPDDGPTDENEESRPDPQDYDSGNPQPLPDEVKEVPPPPDPTIFDQIEKKYDELETEGTFD